MSVHRNRTPRMAALLSVVAISASVLSTTPALAASSHASVSHAAAAQRVAAAKPETVVSRISLASGPIAGGGKVMVFGTKLATSAVVSNVTTYTAKDVKFGVLTKGTFTGVTVDAEDVTALGTGALEVTVPEGSDSALAVSVLVGDATKGPKYTYVGATPSVTTVQDDLDELAPTSEAGLADVSIGGTNFSNTTSVYVGGKKLKSTMTATELKFALPAGLVDVQDVVVVDPRKSFYVGHVTYTATQPSLNQVQAGVTYAAVEAPTTVTVSGGNVNAIASGTFTYDGQTKPEKVTIKTTKDVTDKIAVTIPKGAAANGTVTLSTKFNKTVEFDVVRKASPVPTVTGAVAADGAITKGGVFTLTGTNLVGLKSVTIKSTATDAKEIKGSTITDVTATSAKVKLSKLADGTYTLKATTWNSTVASLQVVILNGAIVTSNDPDPDPEPVAPGIYSAESADGLTVNVTGANLTGITTAVFSLNGSPVATAEAGAAIVEVAGGASLTITLQDPLASGATFQLVLTNAGGSNAPANVTVDNWGA